MNWKTGLAIALFAVGVAPLFAADGPYKVVGSISVGGEGRWDYLAVEPTTHLLYIARATRVQLVDLSSGKLVGEIGGLTFAHGIAFDTAGKFGYISDGYANTVRVFDRSSHQLVANISTGTNPDGILFDTATSRVFVFNGGSKNAAVIDPATNKVLGTIPLPGKPEFPQSDGKGNVYVNIETTSQIVRIDAKAMKVTATWSINPAEEPSGLAFDGKHRRLFSVTDGKMAIVDADTGKVVSMPKIGMGPDAAAYDENSGYAFSSNGDDGNLTVVQQKSANDYAVVQTLATGPGSRTMALDPSTGKIYIPAAEYGPKPAPSPTNPRGRPPVLPGSFKLLVIGK